MISQKKQTNGIFPAISPLLKFQSKTNQIDQKSINFHGDTLCHLLCCYLC